MFKCDRHSCFNLLHHSAMAGDRRALRHLANSLLEVLEQDERNAATAHTMQAMMMGQGGLLPGMMVPGGMMAPPAASGMGLPWHPGMVWHPAMMRPVGGAIAPPGPRGPVITPIIEEPPDDAAPTTPCPAPRFPIATPPMAPPMMMPRPELLMRPPVTVAETPAPRPPVPTPPSEAAAVAMPGATEATEPTPAADGAEPKAAGPGVEALRPKASSAAGDDSPGVTSKASSAAASRRPPSPSGPPPPRPWSPSRPPSRSLPAPVDPIRVARYRERRSSGGSMGSPSAGSSWSTFIF